MARLNSVAIVAAGAVVVKDVPSCSVVAGVRCWTAPRPVSGCLSATGWRLRCMNTLGVCLRRPLRAPIHFSTRSCYFLCFKRIENSLNI